MRREDADPVPFSRLVLVILAHLPTWLLISAATYLVVLALGGDEAVFANIAFATAISWVAGFLVVGAPGGIGVREAVFVACATTITTAGVAAASALTARFIFIVLDLLGSLVVMARWGRPPRAQGEPHTMSWTNSWSWVRLRHSTIASRPA